MKKKTKKKMKIPKSIKGRQRLKLTLEQVRDQFDSKLVKTIEGFGLKDIHDIKQDIYSDMLRRKYLNKYRPKKGAVSTYVYTFARNYCKNVKRNMFFKKRLGRLSTVSLDTSINDGDDRGRGAGLKLSDTIPSAINVLHNIERDDFINRVAKEVCNKRAYSIHSRRNGKINLKKVIDLLVLGYNVREIAKILKVSDLVIIKKFRRLSSKSWIRDYFNIKLEPHERNQQLRRRKNLGMPS